MYKLHLLVLLIGVPVISLADLEISGNQVRMVGHAKWTATKFRPVSGIKWEQAWLTKSSDKILPLVYRGKVPSPLSSAELKKMLRTVLNSMLPASKKLLAATEGIGKEKEALNVGGAYVVKMGEYYDRVILGLAQSGQSLFMVGVMFAPNDKVAATQAKELMESFQFKGVRLFKVSVK